MKKVIWIILAVVALVIVVFVIRYRSAQKLALGPQFIQLTLSTSGTTCQVDQLPARASITRQQPVIWRITNNDCAPNATVEIFDFRRASKTGTPSDPLEDTDEAQHPGRRRTVGAGGQGTIPTRVKNGAAYGVYNYRIKVNGTDFDPEVEVVGQQQ
jgi:hypothetical protein